MKIGLLTYHRAENYGAELQAIALRYFLKNLGNEVYFIDYYPDYHQKIYAIPKISKRIALKNPRLYFHKQLDNLFKYLRKQSFHTFQKKHIIPHCISLEESFDVVIYGSDQIWRKQPFVKTYNPIYFGKNDIQTKLHISYAASIDTLPQTEEDMRTFQELITHLDKISVRESSLRNSLLGMGIKAELSIDPVFLLTKEQWNKIIPAKNQKEKYILYYNLQDTFDKQEIEKFATAHHMRLKIITGKAYYTKDHSINTFGGPDKFISAIRNAQFVFTSSFHGLAFSIIFHKPFYVSVRHGISRIESLLYELNLQNHQLPEKANIPQEISPIDFGRIDTILTQKRRDASIYLHFNN